MVSIKPGIQYKKLNFSDFFDSMISIFILSIWMPDYLRIPKQLEIFFNRKFRAGLMQVMFVYIFSNTRIDPKESVSIIIT